MNYNALASFRRGVDGQIDDHLDFVTATLAGPEMTDFVFAHVLRSARCDQCVITLTARHSVGRAIVAPHDRYDASLIALALLWRGEITAS